VKLPSKVKQVADKIGTALHDKALADRYMRLVIKRHIKEHYYKMDITPTAEQVMRDINPSKLNILCQQGYTVEEIKTIIEDTIRRSK